MNVTTRQIRYKQLDIQGKLAKSQGSALALNDKLKAHKNVMQNALQALALRRKDFQQVLHGAAPSAQLLRGAAARLEKLRGAKSKIAEQAESVNSVQGALSQQVRQIVLFNEQLKSLDQRSARIEHVRLSAAQADEQDHITEIGALRDRALGSEETATNETDLRPQPLFEVAPLRAASAHRSATHTAALNANKVAELDQSGAQAGLALETLKVEGGNRSEKVNFDFRSESGGTLSFEFKRGRNGDAQIMLRTNDERQRRRLWSEKAAIEQGLRSAGFKFTDLRLMLTT